jgi:hypothetical protein
MQLKCTEVIYHNTFNDTLKMKQAQLFPLTLGARGLDLFVCVFDASRPRCKLAVRDELQFFYFLANQQ